MPDETLPQQKHMERFESATRDGQVPSPDQTKQLIDERYRDRERDAAQPHARIEPPLSN